MLRQFIPTATALALVTKGEQPEATINAVRACLDAR